MPGATTAAIASLSALPSGATQNEVFTAPYRTTLTQAMTGGRPAIISVAATAATYGTGTFSIAIFDAGTDANPVNFEALQVVAGGATLSWTVVTENGWNPLSHASGSTVVVTVLTPRSVQAQVNNHINQVFLPDPHTGYVRKANFTHAGDLLVGNGNGTFQNLSVGGNGASLVADSNQAAGVRWTTTPGTTVYQPINLTASATMTATGYSMTAVAALSATTRLAATATVTTQSVTAPAVATSGTIATANLTVSRVSPAGAVTAVILQAWQPGSPTTISVINEAIGANTITFDVAGNSNVADGAGSALAGLTQRVFTWDLFTSLWYRAA